MLYKNKLIELRENHKMKQKDLAKLLNIDRSVYGRYEKEYQIIPIRHLNDLSNYYKVSLDYIFEFNNINQYENTKLEIDSEIMKNRLKEFRKENNTRPLSFASEKELKDMIQILPGSVSPLGILNDKENKVKVFLDKEFIEKTDIIGIHPNDNTATIWLKTKDLINIIKEHGNKVELVEIKEVN